MIPRWLVDKRAAVCSSCQQQLTCAGKFTIGNPEPQCPLGLLATQQDEVAARAWPTGAQQISGCCDSALNYLSRHSDL